MGTPTPELAQLEMLAQADALVERLSHWTDAESPWEPLAQCRALVRRLLWRVETLRTRLESPLIVATFGGTGTGKSALVNALVGRECTESGRQRPTTTRAVLITHPQTELELLGLPLDEFNVVKFDAPLLRDVVLIDCPDPDTTETELQGSNLARLHALLPFCDVLIYTSSQQKYRSARVTEELAQAAAGCRLVFVQTFADLDEDIRDDWRRQLELHYEVPDLFFVDSLRALREQQSGQHPTGDFRRLQDLLATQLSASHRTRIRRANLVDLVQAALDYCREQIGGRWTAFQQVEESLETQQRKLISVMSSTLEKELLSSRGLWERRLIGSVAQYWGCSPFATVLRVYNGLGTWVASAGLFRARSAAQMALIGAVQGARWFHARQQEQQAEDKLDRMAAFGLDDALLRESQLVVAGYVQEARFDSRLVEAHHLDQLRQEAARVEDVFLADASRRVDEIIDDLALKHSSGLAHVVYEVLLTLLVAYIVCWPAYSFFYAHPWLGQPLLAVDFYIHGAIFLALWSGLLVMLFARRLRRGLQQRIAELSQRMSQSRVAGGLFPQLEQACRDVRLKREQLEALSISTADIRRQIAATTSFGSQLAPAKLFHEARKIG